MKKVKNILYVIGAIVLIITIFFKDDISQEFDEFLWALSGVWLVVMIILEVFFRKKK